jgi:hypothetical protein
VATHHLIDNSFIAGGYQLKNIWPISCSLREGRRKMKRFLCAIIMTFGVGLFLIPATIYAQSCPVAPTTPIEQPYACKSAAPVKYSFTVKLKAEMSLILGKMKSIITGKGGSLEGNKESGSFKGKSAFGTIKGEYRSISNTEIEITIDDKPFLLSYSTIELAIRKYLS